VHYDRVGAVVEAPLGAQLGRAWLAGKHVVCGDDQRLVAGEEADVDRLDRRPLEVHDVGCSRGAAVAQHVGNVLDQARRGTLPGARRRRSEPVEALVHLVALRGRNVTVGEAAGHQGDVGAGARERRRQRAIVRGRVSRWIDDVNAHGAA
jgi:hypothetical protein